MIPEIAAEIHRLAETLALEDPRDHGAFVKKWYEEVKHSYCPEWAAMAYDLVTISKARGQSITNIFGEGSVKNEMNAGRDLIGGAQGTGNLVEVGDISAYSTHIERSDLPPAFQEALIEGRRALEGISVSSDVAKSVLENYGKLTIELQKSTPDKGMLKMLWASISSVAGTLAPIVSLGKLVLAIAA